MCGVLDEIHPYLPLVRDAQALVLGTPIQLGMPTGFMFNFLTRLECFHHIRIALDRKPALLVSVGIKPYELQINEGILRFEDMVTHSKQMRTLGHIYFNSGSPPCFTCGEGQQCKVGAYWKYVIGKDEEKLNSTVVSKDLVQHWEDSPEITGEIEKYGKVLETL
jgi:multimeric flavodoxin WrbA